MRRFGMSILGVLVLAAAVAGSALAGSPNGSSGQMPAFYDGKLFTINFKEQPNGQALIAQNKSINTIYMCDQCEAQSVDFTSVLDAIQGDGFNPLWREVQVVFNAGFAPHQLTSDTAILDAQKAGEITLQPTDEVYRCSVVGAKK